MAAKRDGGSLMTTATKAGRKSLPAFHLQTTDHARWLECFRAAIVGVTAAHRRTPNPKMVVAIAAQIADCAIDEFRKRATLWIVLTIRLL